MITLYTFGPYFGLYDPSPFVTKANLLLQIAGIPFAENTKGLGKAPKGKLPYIRDNGQLVADSTFIQRHIEQKYGFDFFTGYSAEQKAIAWAVEKMCDDHLYWAIVDLRWLNEDNFAKGPAEFFNTAPAPLRPVIKAMVRRLVKKRAYGHGMGRHSRSDIEALAAKDLETLAILLADKPFILGDQISGTDATVYAFVKGILCDRFDSDVRQAAEGHANLVAYAERMTARFFPKLAAAQ